MSRSEQMYKEALSLLPGGVDSPVRAFKGVGGTPRFIKSAQGCYLYDVDENQLIDYVGSWGPMILGHAHPAVITALTEAVKHGTSYGAPCPAEVELAHEIVTRVPSVEMVRFVNSGTEATMSAIRLARAATERDLIIKFAGGYHGHGDSFLVQSGSGVATFGLPDSAGVTKGTAQDTRVATYNDLEAIKKLFEIEGKNYAAIIVEPVAGNIGVIPPSEGFLEGLRSICDEYGALLIFDEVMTGFRVAPGGAQQLYGIKPDLSTFGKIIGGGLPVGAYGGRRDLMNMISPSGNVYQAGTLSGNPLAMTAGLATLNNLNSDIYSDLEKKSARLQAGIEEALRKTETIGTVQRVGSMLTLFFSSNASNNYEDVKKADHKRFARFFHSMLKRGIHLPPSGYEAWFVSAAHSKVVIDQTITIVEESLRESAA